MVELFAGTALSFFSLFETQAMSGNLLKVGAALGALAAGGGYYFCCSQGCGCKVCFGGVGGCRFPVACWLPRLCIYSDSFSPVLGISEASCLTNCLTFTHPSLINTPINTPVRYDRRIAAEDGECYFSYGIVSSIGFTRDGVWNSFLTSPMGVIS